MNDKEKKTPPSYIYLPPKAARHQAKLTREGTYDLKFYEIPWRDRYDFLQARGYRLRPRYHPKWTPSWKGTNLDSHFCEDAVVPNDPDVLDATREEDGSLVAIKPVERNSEETRIALYLSSLKEHNNHCAPVVDILDDPLDPCRSLMVMEYLHPWNDPELVMIGDVVDFVMQMLEGLEFLHSHRIAHRDIASLNVMMDGRALYPQGHHPIWRDREPDAIREVTPLLRLDHHIKYFYIDFGLSVRFDPGASPLVVGDVGRDTDVPELSSTTPYDAFKADIYALGDMFDKELEQQYHSLQFLRPLIDSMKRFDPQERPTASDLVDSYKNTHQTLNPSGFRWRLGPKSEPAYERLINDTVAAARDSFSQLRRFVRP